MPEHVHFLCQRCGAIRKRWPNSRLCGRPSQLHPARPCNGRLVRCEAPPEPAPFSQEWLEARAMQAAFARG